MTEQQIQKKIIRFLEDNGAYVVKVITANKSGVPDILACVKGQFIAIEVKRPETIQNTTPLQDYNLNKIKGSGGKAIVASCVDDVRGLV